MSMALIEYLFYVVMSIILAPYSENSYLEILTFFLVCGIFFQTLNLTTSFNNNKEKEKK